MEAVITTKKPGLANGQVIHNYMAQPERLPEQLRARLLEERPGERILLYSYIDLDESLRLRPSWLVLTDKQLIHFTVGDKAVEVSRQLALAEIESAKEISSLSSQRLIVELKPAGGTPLVVRYSHRQSRSVGLIRFMCEQAQGLEGKPGDQRLEVEADEAYQRELLQPLKDAQASVSKHQLDVIWRLLSYLRPYWKEVSLGMAGACLMTLVSLLPPFLTAHIIDHVIKPFQGGQISLAEAQSMAAVAIISLSAVYLLREFFAWIRLRTMSIMGELVARDLRNEVYSHLHRLSLSYFSRKQTGSLISRVGSDTDRIWDFIAFGVVEVSTSVLMLLGLSAVLISLDWPLGVLVTLPIPIILWVILQHGRRMQRLFLRAWRKWSHLTDCLSDTIPGVRVVKAFGREGYETERFRERNSAVVGEFNRIHQTWTSFWPFLMLGIQTLVVTVWVFGLPRVLEHIAGFNANQGEVGLSPGIFVAFVLYLGMYVQPVEVIGQMARMVNRATSSAYRVFEVLDTEPQIIDCRDSIELRPLRGHVQFEDVIFSYDGVRKVLKGVSFDVRPGEMIGLVGPSGSGKSTIVNLLARFYETTEGRVKVDGVDLKHLDSECYRSQVGMVLQDPYLFHGSILDNIRYAQPEASFAEIVAAAQAACAHDFILRLPQAYDTVVGERGHTLSGGERQRISIARALLRDPRVLILDEATSSVDTETERKIQKALDHLVQGRTVFAIAHRLSTLAKADRLLVMKEGLLVEQGTHDELLKLEKGVYRTLVEMQREVHTANLI